MQTEKKLNIERQAVSSECGAKIWTIIELHETDISRLRVGLSVTSSTSHNYAKVLVILCHDFHSLTASFLELYTFADTLRQ